MLKAIAQFFTAKLFLTKGQIITQGMLYALEKEVSDLKASVRGHKASYTKLKATADERARLNAIFSKRNKELELKYQAGTPCTCDKCQGFETAESEVAE